MKRTATFLGILAMVQFAFADGLVRPTQPTYENCTATNQLVYNQDCVSRNQAAEKEYGTQLAAYNEAVRLASQVVAASADTTGTTGNTASATALLADTQKINENGSKKYNQASTLCQGASLALAAAFAISCIPPKPCMMPLLYGSMAFAAFSLLASKQAKSHDAVAAAACQSQAQLSTAGADCSNVGTGTGSTSTGTSPTGTTSVTSVFTPAGTCVAGQEATCKAITDSLPAGTNIKDVASQYSAFASGKKTLPYTVGADGTIKTKDGKTYKASDFASPQAMAAAGLGQADIAAVTKATNASGMGADGKLNAKDALAAENAGSGSSGPGIDAGGGAVIKVAENAANGNSLDSGKDGLDKNKLAGARDPASAEGLVKDFNGELIGASGDDIFKMMNRRYNLKASQDSFIGP